MKKFTKIFSLILAVALIISVFPAAKTEAATYKLSLTGKYDLSDDDKVIYNYSKMMKNVKLEKVEGKNQWNLTMYAGTIVELPYIAAATVDKIKVTTSKQDYVYGSEGNMRIEVKAGALKSKKTLKNNVLTCKAYNEAGKCLSTLKIVVTVLPYNAKLERTKVITAKDLYKLEYRKEWYSDFAWERVVKNYPEILLDNGGEPLLVYIDHVSELSTYGRKVPQYLFDQFGGKDAEELVDNLYAAEAWDVWGYSEELIEAAKYATSCGTDRRPGQEVFDRLDAIFEELSLEQYSTDWEKILAFQKWVKSNIRYEFVRNVSVIETLRTGYTMCERYANLMCTACQRLGVPCYLVDDPFYMGEGHAWNIVLVDGLWCTMDLTWRPGFWSIDTGDFKVSSTEAALSRLMKIFGGQRREDSGMYWDSIEECWEADTED